MTKLKLHIVSFDIPFPADYGGAVDVFYKIKALADAGVEIYLHCYEYGRARSTELEKYCKQVWYYPRQTGIKGISATLPYIVYSRRDAKLLERLTEIDAPILFEGVHSTYYLSHPALKNRFKAIRIHNIEHAYYQELYKKETTFTKKYYYKAEAALLKTYEAKLQAANAFFPLSITDTDFFSARYPQALHQFIGPFQQYNEVQSKAGTGTGAYCLYHGNLGHAENTEAALFLLKEVAPHLTMPIIIAGRNPTDEIRQACKKTKDCKLVANPSAGEMETLISGAQVHVLPTFQATGMKLKLLHALFKGRHVVVNKTMLHGTGLDKICIVADSAGQMIEEINKAAREPFTADDIHKRAEVLLKQYSNTENAAKLITHLQG